LISLRKRSEESSKAPPSKWIKTGIEFYQGKPMLSTVACDAWADWSVAPLPVSDIKSAVETWTTISIIKEEDENGVSLWVYHVGKDGLKTPLREITWVFGHDTEAWDVQILAMAARPAKTAKDDLEVSVKDMVVIWAT
jgi:regulation of enolase protein 1 (concanavalin A-like superfamily)